MAESKSPARITIGPHTAAASSSIGLVSSILGIYQFARDEGASLADRAWDALYYMGFIAVASLGAWIVLGGAAVIVTGALKARRPVSRTAEAGILVLFAAAAIAIGLWLGVLWAESNLERLQWTALEQLMHPGTDAFSPGVMRLIGAGSVVVSLALVVGYTYDRRAAATTNYAPPPSPDADVEP